MASSADNIPENPESGSGESTESLDRRGRVRLRRAAVMAVPATMVAAGLAVLTAQGAQG
ncbi:cholesterol esterase, partial [Streptomyces sp. NPDC058964]